MMNNHKSFFGMKNNHKLFFINYFHHNPQSKIVIEYPNHILVA